MALSTQAKLILFTLQGPELVDVVDADSHGVTWPLTPVSGASGSPPSKHADLADAEAEGPVDSNDHASTARLIPIINAVPMPVSADPSVPDPTSRPHTPIHGPPILNTPGTPTFNLSPAVTPGDGRLTPVSLAVPASISKVLQVQQSVAEMSSSGLFTPGAVSAPDSPEQSIEAIQEEGTPFIPVEDSATSESPFVIQAISPSELEMATPVQKDDPTSDNAFALEQSGDVGQIIGSEIANSESIASVHPVDPSPVEHTSEAKPRLLHRSPAVPFGETVVMTRKSTDPILFADPYPYSLSTPGTEFMDQTKDLQEDPSDEENDNSLSSASTAQGKEHSETTVTSPEHDEKVDSDILSHLDSRPSLDPETRDTTPDNQGTPTRSLGNDDDAGTKRKMPSGINDHDVLQVEHAEDVVDEVDPFTLMGNDSAVAPGTIDDSTSSEDSSNNSDKDRLAQNEK